MKYSPTDVKKAFARGALYVSEVVDGLYVERLYCARTTGVLAQLAQSVENDLVVYRHLDDNQVVVSTTREFELDMRAVLTMPELAALSPSKQRRYGNEKAPGTIELDLFNPMSQSLDDETITVAFKKYTPPDELPNDGGAILILDAKLGVIGATLTKNLYKKYKSLCGGHFPAAFLRRNLPKDLAEHIDSRFFFYWALIPAFYHLEDITAAIGKNRLADVSHRITVTRGSDISGWMVSVMTYKPMGEFVIKIIDRNTNTKGVTVAQEIRRIKEFSTRNHHIVNRPLWMFGKKHYETLHEDDWSVRRLPGTFASKALAQLKAREYVLNTDGGVVKLLSAKILPPALWLHPDRRSRRS